MPVTDRPFLDDDYLRTRELLAGFERRGGPLTWWGLDRLDALCFPGYWEAAEAFHAWERDGRLVGVVHPENGADEAFLELHPEDGELAGPMLAWAEGRHRSAVARGEPIGPLGTTAPAADLAGAAILAARGWRDEGPVEVLRSRSLDVPDPPAPLPAGHAVRLADPADPADLDAVAAVTNAVFAVSFSGATIALEHRFPSPRESVVVVAPDGTVASWCGVTVEPSVGIGWFEPVGTHPDHRRRGLAAAAMTFGLERMRERGARTARVGTGAAMEANRLYVALGFAEVQVYHRWRWSPG